jgi:hypothetical protein
MKTIGRIINFIIWLAIIGLLTFAASYFIPSHLHDQYRSSHREIFVEPISESGDFSQWAASTEEAIGRFQSQRETRKWLLVVLYPGYRGQLHPLEEEFQVTARELRKVIGGMRSLFQNNALMRRTWEQAVLSRPDAGEAMTAAELGKSLAGLLDGGLQNGRTVIGAYVQALDKGAAIDARIEEVQQLLEADKASFRLRFPGSPG